MSACPGLLNIVPTGDGGLCRIRLPAGVLQARQAHAVADAAAQFASGVIEATNRANLQIRGVRPGAESALIEALLAAGLGPQDGAGSLAERDGVRNVMISPLAGRDAAAMLDTRPLAAQLLAALQAEPQFAALSPKFCVLLDGGEALSAIDHPHDVWLAALPGERGAARMALGLAGCPADAAHGAPVWAVVPAEQAVTVVLALLRAFLALATPQQHRMRDVLATHGGAALLQQVQAQLPFALDAAAMPPRWQRPATPAQARIGIHAQAHTLTAAPMYYLGAQWPLGRLNPAQLRQLADASDGILHLTPWQGVLLPDLSAPRARQLQRQWQALGLLTERSAPLAHLIACAGRSGCKRALADVKADAVTLAGWLDQPHAVHLTGCVRSCAAAHCAPWTLLAVADGHYDLYQYNGAAGFGAPYATTITLAQAAQMLNAQPTQPGLI
ncbi:precorrin-3B synthase [Silvimonas sp. JCM 19000]